MSKWQFSELGKNNAQIPVNDKNLIRWLGNALIEAADSNVPDPKFSKYFVKCACFVIDKRSGELCLYEKVVGGNIEYGLCQALHGEESLVAVVKSRLHKSLRPLSDFLVLVAFSSKFKSDEGRVPTCCGNCRDIMRDSFPPDTMIFSGHPDGGNVLVARLHDLLGDDYSDNSIIFRAESGFSETVTRAQLKGVGCLGSGLVECLKLENDIYSPREKSPNPGRNYYAIINGLESAYLGAHDVMCDYHPIYAVRDAVRQARRDNKPQFESVVVAAEHYFPDVMYKDRQHLLELNFQHERLAGQLFDPPVYLAKFERDAKKRPIIETIYRTSVKKWLPFPFSPANFGEEFVRYATGEYKKMQSST